ICQSCTQTFTPWPAVVHRCYRRNRGASATTAALLTVHRMARTYRRAVDRYIALTDFAAKQFIAAGFDAAKIVVKPNFIFPTPEVGKGEGDFLVFVGRVTPEKGIFTLLKACAQLLIPLKIIGDGLAAKEVCEAALRWPRIQW